VGPRSQRRVDEAEDILLEARRRRSRNLGAWIIGGAFLVGIAAGGSFLWLTRGSNGAADATTTAPPNPLVSIPFESQPEGAMVTLVVDGQSLVVGRAPVTAALDPSRQYEAVFALAGYATSILPVDATGVPVSAVLQSVVHREATPPVLRNAGNSAPPDKIIKGETIVEADTITRAEKVAHATHSSQPERGLATGTLLLGSKPPCRISVDGKRTGKSTPQREMSLPAGKHVITLINKEHGIKESFSVNIKAGKSTRTIKDFSSKLHR
jgi:serine/threonine-protein kinase